MPVASSAWREKLEFLQEGLWDAGVRVKKLRGSGRAVFEARLSRGDRILFTLGEPPDGNGAGVTRIYVWGVVKHDDVNTAAARRIVPANAPFLDFEPALVEELPEFVADDLGRRLLFARAGPAGRGVRRRGRRRGGPRPRRARCRRRAAALAGGGRRGNGAACRRPSRATNWNCTCS